MVTGSALQLPAPTAIEQLKPSLSWLPADRPDERPVPLLRLPAFCNAASSSMS